MADATERTCSRCHTTKPALEFYRKRATCRECYVAAQREYEVQRQADPAYRARRREMKRRQRLTMSEEERWKQRSRNIVGNAVRDGYLHRPAACQQCGVTPPRAVEAHHPDHAKPFEVVWLCRSCHAAIHRAERDQRARAGLPRIARRVTA